MSQTSLGIDITQESVAFAYLKSAFGKIRVDAHGVYSLEKEKPLAEKLKIIHALLTDFMKEHRIPSTHIFLGIPGDLTIYKSIDFPLAVKENLRSTLKYEMEKYIPLSVEDIYFDCQVISENKTKNWMSILLIAAKKKTLSPFLEFINRLKQGVSSMEPRSTALANFFVYQSEKRNSKLDTGIIELLKAESDIISSVDFPKTSIPSRDLIPAFALALKGLWNTPLKVNLLPLDMRKKPSKTGYYAMICLSLLVLLSGIAWGGSHILQQRMLSKEIDAEMRRLKLEARNMDQIQEDAQKMEEQIDYLNTLRGEHIPALDMLRELSQLIPESAWIREFRLSKKGLELSGYADSASDLISILEDSPLFKDVIFLSAITKEKDGKERFRIGLKCYKYAASNEASYLR